MTTTPKYNQIQSIFALAMLSYVNICRFGTQEELQTYTTEKLTEFLNKPKIQDLIGAWDIVWGPVVYQAEHSKVSDNLMYVVKRVDQPLYVIAIAGTNPFSLQDLLIQDMAIQRTVPWPYYHKYANAPRTMEWSTSFGFNANPIATAKLVFSMNPKPKSKDTPCVKSLIPVGLHPCISFGTQVGLSNLSNMKSSGLTITEYLANLVKEKQEKMDVVLTGHSLGGALAPTLGLQLLDTQDAWDPNCYVTIKTQPVAGITAGNFDFATYADIRFGDNINRIWNTIDIAPHEWNGMRLAQIPTLYEPYISSGPIWQAWVSVFQLKVSGNVYTHFVKDTPGLQGYVVLAPFGDEIEQFSKNEENKALADFIKFLIQGLYQHLISYFPLLDMVDLLDLLDFLNPDSTMLKDEINKLKDKLSTYEEFIDLL